MNSKLSIPSSLLAMTFVMALAPWGFSVERPVRPLPAVNSSCQLNITAITTQEGSPPMNIQATFRMNALTNAFYDINDHLTIDGATSSDTDTSGNYQGDIGVLNFASALMTITFNPKTNAIITVQQVGGYYTVQSSSLRCRPPLKAPSCSQYVANLYQTVLDTAPDPAGLAYYTNQCATGQQTPDQIQADFYQSPEFVQMNTGYGGYYSTDCFSYLDYFYTEFFYHLPTSADETQYGTWVSQCVASPQGMGQVVSEMIASPEYAAAHASSPSADTEAAPTPASGSSTGGTASFRYYTGSAPSLYTPVETPLGQKKLNSMIQATHANTPPDLGSPDLMPHTDSDQ